MDSTYPHQYGDQDIQIAVPRLAVGKTANSWKSLVDNGLVCDEGVEGGTREGWDSSRWHQKVKITVDRGEGENNLMGGRKKMGFAQVVRETVLKEKGVSFVKDILLIM